MSLRRPFFSDERWPLVARTVRRLARRGPMGDLRRFVEAVVWILRMGAPCLDLSLQFGDWRRVYRRYRRWAVAGRWERLRTSLARPRTGTMLLIDSTIVKAHPHDAGALRASGDEASQALGRSRGGFTTKIHALVTERGELVRHLATGGEASDITHAARVLGEAHGRAVVGDRAYDSNLFLEWIEVDGMHAVIPSRANRKVARHFDRELYAQRNVVERWFGRVKAYRRVATRYDKMTASYLGFVAFVATLIAVGWLG